MSDTNDRESLAGLVALVTKLLGEKEETRRLIADFAKGGVSAERVVNEIAAKFQLEVGGAVRAVAEHDTAAAQQLGARLRTRLDSMLSELGQETKAQQQRATPQAVPAAQPGAKKGTGDFNGRDDNVLRREFVLVSLLLEKRNVPELKAATLLTAIRSFDAGVDDAKLTAHLGRLLKAGLIGQERKGRYQPSRTSQQHLAALSGELEARGLSVPTVPRLTELDGG